MFSFKTNFQKIAGIVAALLLVIFIGYIYSTFFKSSPNGNGSFLLVMGLLLGAVIMFLISNTKNKKQESIVREDSHTVVESIRRVFKIVCAEGQLNELYNFEDTRKLFGFIPSTKRALVIIQAKVLIGYDFEKCVWEADDINKKIKLVSFPDPEILSIETDYKYYNFDEGIFNLLNRNDLTRIQANGKKQVELAAIKSHLPKIAADQMRTVLTEVVQSKNWQLEDGYKINNDHSNTLIAPATRLLE